MNKFHSLTVSSIKSLTTDSVAISFDTLNNELFQFISGQSITIKHQINGEEVRRVGIITDECRGMGNRAKDNRPFLHYWDIEKQGYRYATNWKIL